MPYKNLDKRRKYHREYARKSKWGVTPEELENLLMEQGYRCAICRKVIDGGRMTHVDHNHKTGKIRGLLCNPCNRGIGYLQDDPEIVEQAYIYLQEKECQR